MRTLDEIMAQEPTLSRFGFGVYDGIPLADRGAALANSRQELRQRAGRVHEICEWIRQHLRPTHRANPYRSSYGLKHIVEQDLDYVANGELIAAMLMCGYRFVKIGPNARFNLSEKTVRAVTQRQEMARMNGRRFQAHRAGQASDA
jgi:hypothetical protein